MLVSTQQLDCGNTAGFYINEVLREVGNVQARIQALVRMKKLC